ncbi:toll/interleukin-1 receptor domain-containing protein [Bradyrhizobium embrapense]|uniref:toll/interleukin-1 receptor domain-containing protein n=1 Tax=Bradyrhizobium embrapense TaxID=630921 RepID=UPI000A023A63|nr:toll/interleukin-1 receptor domain-containing protein [Bradyrhizobium embrapense]
MPDQKPPKANFLRLVTPTSPRNELTRDSFARHGWQNSLFASENTSLAIFIGVDQTTEADFATAISSSRPRAVIDIRKVPRFDLGSLNRRRVFALFTSSGTQYFDVSGKMSQQAPREMADRILSSRGDAPIEGPLAFLVDSDQLAEDYISSLLEALPGLTQPWDVLRVPTIESPPQLERRVIFISHANPQDNAFATWLSQQLSLLGYDVWADISNLDGGELFWDDIERTIRSEAAKVIVVLSKSAQHKPGVLDEIDLAVRIERANSFRRFVLPVRLDDLPFSEVRANLGRKNIVDFSANWATGLQAIASVLEKDRVPRAEGPKVSAINRWIRSQLGNTGRLVATPERVISNWLPITQLPSHVRLFSISLPLEKIQGAVANLRVPSFRYHRLVGSFSEAPEIHRSISSEISFKEEYAIPIEEFLRGKTADLPGMRGVEARKIVSSLLRQTWDFAMMDQGLIAFATAAGGNAWYMPAHFLEQNKVQYIDEAGKRRRKSLVGWSERRKVFWHFAVESRPSVGIAQHFVLRPHVIFTADGRTPVASKERMHLLRRRFCKSWWNDRWRDLLIAFVSWLNTSMNEKLPIDGQHGILIAPTLMSLESPASLSAPSGADDITEKDELDSDELDDIDDMQEAWVDETEDDGP